MGQPDSMNLDDCGTAEWPLSANATLAALDQDSLGSLFALQGLNPSTFQGSSDSSNSSVPVLDGVDVSAVLRALGRLACVSQLCCGLQVMPSSVVSISNGSGSSTEPPVLASDGPAQNMSAEANVTQVGTLWQQRLCHKHCAKHQAQALGLYSLLQCVILCLHVPVGTVPSLELAPLLVPLLVPLARTETWCHLALPIDQIGTC
jgi:hypothetical protein